MLAKTHTFLKNLVYLPNIFKTSVRELQSLLLPVNRKNPLLPVPLTISLSVDPLPSFSLLLSFNPYTSLYLLYTSLLLSLPHTISLSLTDAAWRAGLPVVSIFHLDAGDSALALQFISWITREGHRVTRLPPFPVATTIHGNTWISAGCRK